MKLFGRIVAGAVQGYMLGASLSVLSHLAGLDAAQAERLGWFVAGTYFGAWSMMS